MNWLVWLSVIIIVGWGGYFIYTSFIPTDAVIDTMATTPTNSTPITSTFETTTSGTDSVHKFTNSTYGYSVDIPTGWEIGAHGGEESTAIGNVVFGSFCEVLLMECGADIVVDVMDNDPVRKQTVLDIMENIIQSFEFNS